MCLFTECLQYLVMYIAPNEKLVTEGIQTSIYWSIPQDVLNSVTCNLLHLTCTDCRLSDIICSTKEKRRDTLREKRLYCSISLYFHPPCCLQWPKSLKVAVKSPFLSLKKKKKYMLLVVSVGKCQYKSVEIEKLPTEIEVSFYKYSVSC